MTLTTAYSQNRQIVVDKVNDNVRIIEAKGTCIGGFTATKLLFIAMQTYVSPQDTVHKIITNVNTSHPLGAFDDAIMLIRTMNDEVIELHSANSNNNVKTTMKFLKLMGWEEDYEKYKTTEEVWNSAHSYTPLYD